MGDDKDPALNGATPQPDAAAAEAQAEEAFINEQEDAVNPLVNEEKPTEPADDLLGDNAVGSGNLEAPAAAAPINNEQVLGATQPESPAQPVAAAAGSADPAKKKKTGLIVGIVVAAVLLIGGIIGALVFVSIHESKERIQADAFMKFFGVKLANNEITSASDDAFIGATQFDGTASFKFGDETEATLTMNSKSSGINQIAENTLSVKYGDQDFKLKVSAAYFKGGSFYLKLNDIADLRDALVDVLADNIDASSDSIKDLVEKVFKNAIDVLEDQWIVINADTFEELGYKDEYSCIMGEFDKLAEGDQKKDLLKAYKDNQFMSFEDLKDGEKVDGAKDGLTYYKLKIDDGKLESFGKAVSELDYSDRFEKCIESGNSGVSTKLQRLAVSSDDDDDDFNWDDEDYDYDDYDWTYDDETDDIVAEEEEVKPIIYIGIKGWSHEAQHIVAKADDGSYTVDMAVGYDKQDLQQPNAKSLKEVAESLYGSVKETVISEKNAVLDLCDEYYTSAYDIADCKQMVGDMIDEFDGMDFEEFIDFISENFEEPDPEVYEDWDDEDWDL